MIKSKILFSDDIHKITNLLKIKKIKVFVTTNQHIHKYFYPIMNDLNIETILIDENVFELDDLSWIYKFREYECYEESGKHFEVSDFKMFLEDSSENLDVIIHNKFNFSQFFSIMKLNIADIRKVGEETDIINSTDTEIIEQEKYEQLKQKLSKTEKNLQKRIAQVERYKNRKVIKIVDSVKRKLQNIIKRVKK